MPGQKKKGGDDSDEDEESEEESSDEEEEEEADADGKEGDKAKNDNPFDEPTPEFVNGEKNKLQELELNQKADLPKLVEKIVPTRTSREYRTENDRIARDFLKMHYHFSGDPERDVFSVMPTFHGECEVNFGSGRIFKGAEEVSKALVLACGDVKLTYDIKDITIDKKIKRGLLLSFTATVQVSVDGDAPRKVMEIYELKRSKKEAIVDQYVCSKLLTVLNDPRPLYVFNDIALEITTRDNMEPWARALMPATPEELAQMERDREAAEFEEMAAEDAVATAYEYKFRYEEKMAKKKAEMIAEKARKAAMFGGDDDDDDEEGGDEDADEDADGDSDKVAGSEGEDEDDEDGSKPEGDSVSVANAKGEESSLASAGDAEAPPVE